MCVSFFNNNAQTCYSVFTETRAIQTIKTNQVAELKQWIRTFSNPAKQMSGAVVMLARLWCYLQEKYTSVCCSFYGVVDWIRNT